MYLERRQRLARWVLLVDAILIAVAFVGAFYIRFDHSLFSVRWTQHQLDHLALGAGSVATWLVALRLFDLYDPERYRRAGAVLLRVLISGATAALVVGALLYFLQAKEASRLVLGLTFLFSSVTLWTDRLIAYRLAGRHAVRGSTQVLVIGTGEVARRLGDRLERHAELGCELIGFISVDPGERSDDDDAGVAPERVVGTLADLERMLVEQVVDQVAIAVSAEMVPKLEHVVDLCEELGVDVSMVVQFFDRLLTRASFDRVHDLPLVSLHTTPQFRAVMGSKRLFDVLGALALLVLTAPIAILGALAVRLSSRGPVIYAHQRLGLHGRRFQMYKLRTMVHDADQRRGALADRNEMAGPVFKMRHDPRVTPVGRLLRRFSIDELPQLFNVLRGDMSLVGPRPPLADEVAQYDRRQRRRLSVKPGVTCTWQVSGRNELDFEQWMRLDLEYIAQWSPWLDIRILLRTIPAVLSGRGAS